MKKITLTFISVAILLGIAFTAQKEEQNLSELCLANIEALAEDNESENYDCIQPYTMTCSIEGDVIIPGVKYKL